MSLKDFLRDSSDFFLPKRVDKFLNTYIVGNDKSTFYISYWSIVHFISGIIFGFVISKYLITKNNNFSGNNYYLKALVLHTIWELWQIFIESTDISTARGIVDTTVDTLFFMIGATLYRVYLDKLM